MKATRRTFLKLAAMLAPAFKMMAEEPGRAVEEFTGAKFAMGEPKTFWTAELERALTNWQPGQMQPNMLVVSPRDYQYLKNRFQTQARFVNKPDGGAVLMGLSINGAKIIPSPFVPPGQVLKLLQPSPKPWNRISYEEPIVLEKPRMAGKSGVYSKLRGLGVPRDLDPALLPTHIRECQSELEKMIYDHSFWRKK